MNKILAGLLFGLVLGAIDGATAWFYPETHSAIGGILVGSSIKGMLVGLLSGWFARRVQSTKWGIVLGAALGQIRKRTPRSGASWWGRRLKACWWACSAGGSRAECNRRNGGSCWARRSG